MSTQASSPIALPVCPEVLSRKNCFVDSLTDQEAEQVRIWRLEAARRLRAALSSTPFYADRAERARLAGNEMAYWLDLQGSQMTNVLPWPEPSTLAPTEMSRA